MSMKLHRESGSGAHQRSEAGYVLLTLLLLIALMIIAAAAIIPTITFEIKRDREEEMIHRGTQYSRAIRAYYKKFGRYPNRIEELQSSNNIRFLRKRYKDPLNCKPECQDFKLLHYGDVQMAGNFGIGGGTIPGASPIGGNSPFGSNPGLNGPGGFGQNSSFGSNSSFGQNSSFSSNSSFGGNSTFGANSNSSFGQNSQAQNNPPSGSDSNSATGTDQSNAESSQSSSGDKPNTTFGGGPIVGVASAIKDKTIREFNHKHKYNEWQFIYDPATDRGQLITTPNQPLAQFGQGIQNVNAPGGAASPTNSGFGGGAFSGMQSNPSQQPSGFGNSNQPANPPPQQQ
jgi:type II secretory pathway pseudopilin PulG